MKKLLMLMKLCLLFICVFTLTLSASSFAQQERVSFDLKNVSVKVLLDEIQKQTNWSRSQALSGITGCKGCVGGMASQK